MNDIVTIQLFRIAASLPWAEVKTTQHNIVLVHYDDSSENAQKAVMVLSKNEAADLAKALKVLVDKYCYDEQDEI